MASLRIRLSAMMFLQYAIWGAWAPILGLHLLSLEDFASSMTWVSYVYMTMPLASFIAPFIGGQIADRWFASQRFLGISQILGGVMLFVVARLQGHVEIFVAMFVYTLIYAPTIALTNSIVFRHWPNEQFSRIRMWGSIGWIVIAWVFAVWLGLADDLIQYFSPAWRDGLVAWRQSLTHKPAMVDCLYIAGGLSLLYGILCFGLPDTPPSKNPGRPWAFLDALMLMRNRAFAVMTVVAFLVGIELQFYFVWTQSLLNQGGGPFDAKQIDDALAKAGSGASDVFTAGFAAELVASADKTGDAKLNRAELAAAAASNPAAKAFLDVQNRLTEEKGGLGLEQKWVSPVLAIGQICEMAMMVLLPLILRAAGFRWTIGIGIGAWALRDFILALGKPAGLVIASISLHGVGFALFCTTIFIFADSIAPKDIKASAQSLLASVTFGLGMLVGSLVSGPVVNSLGGDWHRIYLVPAVLCTACCIAFLLGFRPRAEPGSQRQ